MKKNILMLMLVSSLSAVFMNMMACGQISKERVETEAAAPDSKADVRVVVATSNKGMTIYQSPSKSALVLTLVEAGTGGVFYQWAQKGKHILRDSQRDAYHSAIVIDVVNQWYKVSQDGITGYVSQDDCKEARILQITNEMMKESLDCHQQQIDGKTYYTQWGVYNFDYGTAIQIMKIENNVLMVQDVGYFQDEEKGKNVITFYPNDQEVSITNPRYCKENPDPITSVDLMKLLKIDGFWDNASKWLKVEDEKDWVIIPAEPKGDIWEDYEWE